MRTWEPAVQWAALIIFSAGVIFSMVWNVMANTWTSNFFPPLDKSPLDLTHCKDYHHIG